jgi:hypothetical protein
MRVPTQRVKTPSTAKAIGVGLLVVGGYWLAFGAATVFILRPSEQTIVAERLPPADPNGKQVDASRPLPSVGYKHFTLRTVGQPLGLDASKLAFLGQTNEGYGLWSEKPSGGGKSREGGGGGPGVPRALPAATGTVYLRTTDNRWWQVEQQP